MTPGKGKWSRKPRNKFKPAAAGRGFGGFIPHRGLGDAIDIPIELLSMAKIVSLYDGNLVAPTANNAGSAFVLNHPIPDGSVHYLGFIFEFQVTTALTAGHLPLMLLRNVEIPTARPNGIDNRGRISFAMDATGDRLTDSYQYAYQLWKPDDSTIRIERQSNNGHEDKIFLHTIFGIVLDTSF